MSERELTKSIISLLTRAGFWTLKIHGGPYQMSGIPDILGIRNGRAYWLEVKVPGNTASKIQARRIDELRAVGCVAEVVDSISSVVDILAAIDLEFPDPGGNRSG